MGLFDKKYCDVCGEKIGLLGNRKLEDGNLCKECAKKLSPWFSDRRRSTVEEIKAQLADREENRGKAAQFRTTRAMGEGWKVLLDEEHRWFTVTRARDLAEANPDILDFLSVDGLRFRYLNLFDKTVYYGCGQLFDFCTFCHFIGKLFRFAGAVLQIVSRSFQFFNFFGCFFLFLFKMGGQHPELLF